MKGLTLCRRGGRKRDEQHLSRRLVQGVAHRRTQHPGTGNRPEGAGEEDDGGADAEADRQQEEGDSDPGGPVNTADERNLNDEPCDRQVGRDLGQECRDAVAAAAQRFGRHVQLLLDDGGARRGATHRQGQHLQGARFGEQRDGLPTTDALLGCVELGLLTHSVPAQQQQHDSGASGQRRGADQHELLGAHLLDDGRCHTGAQGAAETGAAADESEQTLRLARVEEIVRQCPELADQENAQDQAEEVERDRDPRCAGPQQRPEDDKQPDDGGLREGYHVLAGHAANGARIKMHDEADQDAREEQDVRQIVRAECGNELRTRDGLQNVVRRHREEGIGEHQERRRGFLVSNGRHGTEESM